MKKEKKKQNKKQNGLSAKLSFYALISYIILLIIDKVLSLKSETVVAKGLNDADILIIENCFKEKGLKYKYSTGIKGFYVKTADKNRAYAIIYEAKALRGGGND